MNNVVWGLVNGWFAATGLAVFPTLLAAFLGGGLEAFEEFGGVGRYVLWCYTAGTLGGLTIGIGRRFLTTAIGRAVVVGLVTAEAFGLQLVMLWEGIGASTGWVVIPVFFVVGAAMSPLFTTGFGTWPWQG